LQPAMDWLLAHSEDPDIDEPIAAQSVGGVLGSAPSSSVETPKAGGEDDDGEIKDGEQTAQSLQCNDCGKLFRDAAAAEFHAVKTQHINFSESTTAIKPLREEEKRAKLADTRQRLAEVRAAKKLEELEEMKKSEKIRRSTGKEITEAKEHIAQLEMKKALAERSREKEEEKKAKEKVRRLVEQDKLERAAKKEKAKQARDTAAAEEAAVAAAASTAPAAPKEYTEARLQIRLDTGGPPLMHTFPAETLLAEVYEYVAENRPGDGAFKLSTAFPRTVLSDQTKTLKELNLVPSTALIVMAT